MSTDLKSKLSSLFQETRDAKIDKNREGVFSNLPDGYYLAEVDTVKLGLNKAETNFQLIWTLVVVEGYKVEENKSSQTGFDITELDGVANRKMFAFHSLKDSKNLISAKQDILKFEDENGESIVPIEFLDNEEVFEDALDLVVGNRIYIHVETDKKDPTSQWKRFVSWKRATDLGLPV